MKIQVTQEEYNHLETQHKVTSFIGIWIASIMFIIAIILVNIDWTIAVFVLWLDAGGLVGALIAIFLKSNEYIVEEKEELS